MLPRPPISTLFPYTTLFRSHELKFDENLLIIDGFTEEDATRSANRILAMKTLPDGIFITNDFRSEEHTSELQSPDQLVCRLLLEKKNKQVDQAQLAKAFEPS